MAKTKTKAATREYRSYTDTMNMVYQGLFHAEQPMSQLEIARDILRRKGKYPALRAILNRMVEIRWIRRIESVATNRHLVYKYSAIKYDENGVEVG